jgi:hypothetical protein
MKRLLGRIVVGLWVGLFLAATASGSSMKSVYLKDGGVIDCVSFWKKDGMVMVRVNRDVLIDLANEEVDITRTFAKKHVKPVKKKAKIAKKVRSTVTGAPAVAVQPAAKPGATPAIAVQPVAKTGAAPAVAVQPAAKPSAASAVATQPAVKVAAASPAASTAALPRGKPQADVKPSVSPAAAPTRKTLTQIMPKPAVSADAGLAGLLRKMLLPILLVFVIVIGLCWKIFSLRRAKRLDRA